MSAREVAERRVGDEYALATQRYDELLRRCGVLEDDLSKNGQLYLDVLSESAAVLKVRRPSTSALLAAMGDLQTAVDAAESRADELRAQASAAHRQSRELQREWQDLRMTRRQLDAAAEEREKHENSVMMEQRAVEYQEQRRASEAQLASLEKALQDVAFDQIRDRMEHHNLDALEKECQELEADSRALRDEMSAMYHDLPLNKDAAAGALLEARLELQRLEDQFNARIQQMI